MNSIFTKYQDNQYVAPDKKFEQPVLQTLQMFIGEAAAFIFVFLGSFNNNGYERISTKPQLPRSRSLVLAIPAICDLCGTTLMNLGLMYTPVSIYQMTRGALILFVALFSVLFLKRTINRVEWLSLSIVVLGIIVVGLSGKSNAGAENTESASKLLLGITLVLVAQVLVATQFVVEEHIVGRWTVEPLTLVGYEGTFGGSMTLIAMFVGYTTIGRDTNGPFDMVNSFREFWSNEAILYSSIAIMISIGLFNFIGITLTSKLSATARSTIDTCRTALVWIVSLAIGWESFVFTQLIGFILLGFGTLVFNGAIVIDQYLPKWFTKEKSDIRIIDVVDEQIERL
jgi:drug/metabolite transporter (DMT)-like permease